ncbi:MAG: histidinol-phosphate transaminase [Chloroflexia bacterium]
MRGDLGTQRHIREAVTRLVPRTLPPTLDRLALAANIPADRIIKLDQNENPYGSSLRVQEALAAYDRFHLYPDPEGRAVRERLATYTGMPAERIMLGNGADELIDLVYLLTVDPGDEVLVATPTFDLYGTRAELRGARVIEVPRLPDFSLDIDAMVQATTLRTKVITLVSPNNPTGNAITTEQLVRLLRLGPLVVLDEAYYEFAERSFLPLAREFDNLIVLRTFSKWAGLAGLRLGYGIFPAEFMPYLWRIKSPYNVNAAALVAALATFEDLDWLRSTVVRIRVERARLYRQLRKLSIIQPYPSQGNFIFCRVLHGEAGAVRERLADSGIIVRGYDAALSGYLRISVGRPEDTDALMKALLSLAERI